MVTTILAVVASTDALWSLMVSLLVILLVLTLLMADVFILTPRIIPACFHQFPVISLEWKNTYKRRTAAERCNKREKLDYSLEAGRHRSTKMWTLRIYGIMMCQHMDAWFKECDPQLQFTLLTA